MLIICANKVSIEYRTFERMGSKAKLNLEEGGLIAHWTQLHYNYRRSCSTTGGEVEPLETERRLVEIKMYHSTPKTDQFYLQSSALVGTWEIQRFFFAKVI